MNTLEFMQKKLSDYGKTKKKKTSPIQDDPRKLNCFLQDLKSLVKYFSCSKKYENLSVLLL